MSLLGGSVERLQCPICGCVMHGSAHYGSLVTCRKIVELQAKIAVSASELSAAREQVRRLREAADWVLHVAHGVGKAGEGPEPGEYEASMDALEAEAFPERVTARAALAETAQPTMRPGAAKRLMDFLSERCPYCGTTECCADCHRVGDSCHCKEPGSGCTCAERVKAETAQPEEGK